jgi:hypothetical protein
MRSCVRPSAAAGAGSESGRGRRRTCCTILASDQLPTSVWGEYDGPLSAMVSNRTRRWHTTAMTRTTGRA